jgi:hypothetical protein
MFSQGQLVFAGLFVVAFVIADLPYRKDLKIPKHFTKATTRF